MKRLPLIIFALFFLAYDALAAPRHSINLGNTWMCQNGYKKVGEACQKINVPDNAVAVDDKWMCKNGYKKIENSCKKMFVPENAIAVGDIWMCRHGFKKIGNGCAKSSVLPKNAIVIAAGDRWQCKSAFKRLGDSCVEKTYGELVQTIDWLESNRDKPRLIEPCFYFYSIKTWGQIFDTLTFC